MAVTTLKSQKGINQIKRLVERIRNAPSPFSVEFPQDKLQKISPVPAKSVKENLQEERNQRMREDKAAVREITLITSTIALGAKLAKIDGAINQEEVSSVKNLLPKNNNSKMEIGSFFGNAAKEDLSFEHYAKRVVSYFPKEENIHKELLLSLFEFAAVDGPLNVVEINFLHKVSQIFGLNEDYFYSAVRDQIIPKSHNPYHTLGISEKSSEEEIKAAYRKSVQLYHPDHLSSMKVSERIISIANERFGVIQNAYNKIKKMRAMK